MQVLSSAAPRRAGSGLPAVLSSALVGVLLLAAAVGLGYLTFGTSFIDRFSAPVRPSAGQTLAGLLVWSFALTAPACLVVIGFVRLAGTVDHAGRRGRPRSRAIRFGAELGGDYAVATRVRPPEGGPIGEVVIGPFGAAVIAALPPTGASRQLDGRWEVRLKGGRWLPLENPLAKAARDADRVRRWLGHDDQNFIVKTYAAVVAPDKRIARTPTCAVIEEHEIGAWLASLPVQRGLNASRRESLVTMLRESF